MVVLCSLQPPPWLHPPNLARLFAWCLCSGNRRRPRARNSRLAHHDAGKAQTMSRAKFMYANTHTLVGTDLWNLLPQNFALLQYEITRWNMDFNTRAKIEGWWFMYLSALILVNKTLEQPQSKLFNRNDWAFLEKL